MSSQTTYGMLDHEDDFLAVDHEPTISEKQDEIIDEQGVPVFWGNKRHKVYHDKECYCVRAITPSNLVGLDESCIDEDGRLYRACGHCLASGNTVRDYIEKLEQARLGGDD